MRSRRLSRGGFCLTLLFPDIVSAQITGTPPPTPVEAATARTVDEPPTIREFEIVLPLRVEGRVAGSVPVRSSTDALLAIDAGRLADALEDEASLAVLTGLRALEPGLVPVAVLDGTALTVAFDPQALAIEVTLPATSRATRVLDLSANSRYGGYALTDPAQLAIGIDGDLVLGRALEGQGRDAATLFLGGFANIGGYDGVYLDAAGSLDLVADDEEPALRRNRLTLFKDDPARAIRYSAIDIRPDQPPLSGFPVFLGLSAERRFDEIDPDRTTRALGRRILLLERPGVVEILVNDTVVKRFAAEAGRLDLRDIPFADTGNRVAVVVEDALGRREVDAFAFSSDEDMLAPGLSEFGIAAGFLQPDIADEIGWQTREPGFSAYYRRGIDPALTLGGFVTAQEDFAGAGTNLVAAIPYGILQVDAALALSRDTASPAAQAIYSADLDTLVAPGHRFDLRLAFAAEGFATLGNTDTPIRHDRFAIDAAYRLPLGKRTSATFAGSLVRERRREARLGLSLSHRFDRVVASLLMQRSFRGGGEDDTSLFASLSFPFREDYRFRATHATTGNRSTVEAERRGTGRVGDHRYLVRAERDEEGLSLSGDASYTGNRFLLSGALLRSDIDDTRATYGTLRFGSGVAFADGRLGIGRRVAGGFVLVAPHATLSDASLTVANSRQRAPLASSDSLGPAVVPSQRRYGVAEYAVGLENAPLGYDLGEGSYAMRSGALSGFSVVVGSDAYRSVRGIATDAGGNPLALETGRVVRFDGEGDPMDIFTNRTGRFAVTGLAPGRHILQLGRAQAVFEVTNGETAFTDLGPLTLE